MQDIINKVVANGGITLDPQGKAPQFNGGYMVSIEGFEKCYNMENLDIKELEKDYKRYINFIANKKHVYVGFWLDKGVLYMDISKHIKTRHQAVTMGINNKQLSIYDVKNDSYIDLTKNVYIVYSYNASNNDIGYIREYTNTKDIERDYNIKNARQYITNTIEDIKKIMLDRYVIITDRIPAWEI